MKSILLVKTFLGLVEMTSGLVNASFSLPYKWQALRMIFFAPCSAWHFFMNGVSLDWPVTYTAQLSTSRLSDNSAYTQVSNLRL